jgi:hypothetical protein
VLNVPQLVYRMSCNFCWKREKTEAKSDVRECSNSKNNSIQLSWLGKKT